MKRTGVLIFVLAIFTLTAYARGPVDKAGGPVDKAGGPADKVTGEFTYNNVHHRLISAHEATGKHPQKGFFLSWRDSGVWYEIDLSDAYNSCVNVFADGQARIGGLITDGETADNEPYGWIGLYVGFNLVDGGEPGLMVDTGFTYRVSTDKDSDNARQALLSWCGTGDLETEGEAVNGPVVWPPAAAELNGAWVWGLHVVTDGNLQVHYSPGDID